MAGYGGYFLGGMASGLKSGFNLGQMKWQQNEKKKLQKKQDEMLEASSVFNNMVAQLGEDGSYSDDDMMKINTSYMALGYDVKERVDGTYKAIQAMDKKTIEANYQWFDLVLDSTQGMTSGDAQGIFDTVRPFVSGEKGLQTYEALESITKKRADISQNAPPAPEDVWGQAGVLPMETRPDYLRSRGIDIPQPAITPEAPPTELESQGNTKKKLDYAYNTGNASYFNQTAKSLGVPTTFETYGQGYKKPEAVGEGGGEEGISYRTGSLPQQTAYKEKLSRTLTAKAWDSTITEYTDAKDTQGRSYDPSVFGSYEEHATAKLQGYYDNLVKNKIIDPNTGTLIKGKTKGKDSKGNTVEVDNLKVYESIVKKINILIDELQKKGMDVSQYKKLKPLSEIEKNWLERRNIMGWKPDKYPSGSVYY